MFDNLAIDVFLGLMSIFLLYSLLASILMESLAKYLGLRARITLRAISKLLEDSDHVEGDALRRFFSTLSKGHYFKSFENRELTALFYAHPNIKNLGQNDLFRKPSDVSPEMFADTFIQILRGDNYDNEKNSVELIKSNLKLATGSIVGGVDLPVPEWYTLNAYQPVKNKQQSGNGNTPAVPKTVNICALTVYQLKQFLLESNSDVDVFKKKLTNWYNEMMGRASGWYTKQTRILLFFIGFAIAISFNVDTIAISKKLSNDKELRDKMIEFGSRLQNNRQLNQNDSIVKATNTAILANLTSINKELNEVNSILGKEPIKDFKAINIVGWLITAFAISLGAPFWFDLLGKIMSVRQSGVKSEEKTTSSTSEPIG